MRLLRLKLKNYRGVDSADVNFAREGLTIVQGRNEAGKSSLVEAVELLFNYMDSSKNQKVKDVKPVHKDEGPEIELEAESGDYALVYRKRFLKKPETILKVEHPFTQNFTGREAHERAQAILKETIDVSLWHALLMVRQGEAMETAKSQAELFRDQAALSNALDVEAGGYNTDPHQDSLFKRIHQEYRDHYTEKTGKETKVLMDIQDKEEEFEDEVDGLKRRITAFEADTDRSAELDGEIKSLDARVKNLRNDIAKYTAELEESAELRRDIERAGVLRKADEQDVANAKRDVEERRALIGKYERLNSELEDLSKTGESEETMKKVQEDFALKEADFKKAEIIWKESENTARLRREDYDYLEDKLRLQQLNEQKGLIDQLRLNAAAAEKKLNLIKVDAKALDQISEAETALTAAKAKLEVAGPNVRVSFLKDTDMMADGNLDSFKDGEESEFSVPEHLTLEFPGIARLDVSAGSGMGEHVAAEKRAQNRLQDVCAAVRVENYQEARRLFEERREAERIIESNAERQKQTLRNVTYEELQKQIFDIERLLYSYSQNGEPRLNVALDRDEALRERQQADENIQVAYKERSAASERLEEARRYLNSLKESVEEKVVAVKVAKAELENTKTALEFARARKIDGNLEDALLESETILKRTIEKEKSVKAALDKKQSEQIKILSETATGSLQTAEEGLRSAQKEKDEVNGRLSFLSEEGLQEKLDTVTSSLEHTRQERAALLQRASAARLLYQIMSEERDNARLRYVEPLKDKVEALGRILFGASFQVGITENLSIESRTLEGVRVLFDSLSGGTKEQLSLILRIACAIIVSDRGGPLILDDALGYADSERLKSMGAVIAQAGRMCQIIILTCVPERYAHIGAAQTSNLI